MVTRTLHTTVDRLERLKRALRVAARIVTRFEGTEWEVPAIKIFERLERAVAQAEAQDSAKNRAKALLGS